MRDVFCVLSDFYFRTDGSLFLNIVYTKSVKREYPDAYVAECTLEKIYPKLSVQISNEIGQN